ncbi:hypothetical protein OAF27_02045 [Verrucomicrobiales bacterium]|nr:hypothetical protein [Verrucomicrobiales bacterium]
MSFLRRPEIWILVVIATIAAYFALRAPETGSSPPTQPDGSPAKLIVTGLTLTRDHGNARLDIAFNYDNRGGTEITLAPPAVVMSAGEESVLPFFLVGDFPDPLPADRRTAGTAKYWLEPEHFARPITFEINGESVALKSSEPFDIKSLENAEPTAVTPGNW